jgi:hypothetical protein
MPRKSAPSARDDRGTRFAVNEIYDGPGGWMCVVRHDASFPCDAVNRSIVHAEKFPRLMIVECDLGDLRAMATAITVNPDCPRDARRGVPAGST